MTACATKLLGAETLAALLAAAIVPSPAMAQSDGFNDYVMRAVVMLDDTRAGKGYNIRKAYSQNIPYGGGEVKATAPPETMCVAAVAEVMITAINLYAADKKDKKPYEDLPVVGWNRMRPTDLRSHIWVDPRLDSYGTADAMVTFGIGKRIKFAELQPGSFVNINRQNKTGHAVVFIAFLDKDGKETARGVRPDPGKVAGFKYFSAQNRNSHGFGYGYAFFSGKDGKNYCPDLHGPKPDCGVIYSTGQKILNTGYMLHPNFWNSKQRKTNLDAVVDGLYVQTRSRGPSFLNVSPDLDLKQFTDQLQDQDTMQLNPIFENDQD